MESTMTPSEFFQVAEIDLIYKSKVKASLRPKIAKSEDAYKVFLKIWDPNKLDFVEHFKVLFLNRANAVLACFQVSTGGITGTVADPRLIFTAALKVNAVSLILAHNHPSGNLFPSTADQELTLKIKEAGKFLEIKLLDHIILSSDGYCSFADEGLL